MVKLPGAQDVQQIGIRQDPGVRRPAPVSSGLQELGSAISQVGSQFQRANDARVLSNLTTESMVAFDDKVRDLETDPDSFETWESQLEDFAKERKKEYGEKVTNRNVRDAFDRDFTQIQSRARAKVLSRARETMVNKGVAELDTNLKAMREIAITSISKEGKNEIVSRAKLAIESAQDTGFITDTMANSLREDIKEDVEMTRFKNALLVNPRLAKDALNGGDYDFDESKLPALRKVADNAIEDNRPKEVRDESRVLTEGLELKYPDDQEKQIQAARKQIKDTDVLDATEKRIKARFNEKKAFEAERKGKLADSLTYDVMQMIGEGATQQEVEDDILSQITASDGDIYKQLNTLIRSEYKAVEKETDFGVYLDARGEIEGAADSGKKLTTEYLRRKYAPFLKESHMTTLLTFNDKAVKLVVRASYKTAKENIDTAYLEGVFGPLKKRASKALKAAMEQDLSEYIESDPKGDPAEFTRTKIAVQEQDKLSKDLNSWSDRMKHYGRSTSSVEMREAMTDESLAREFIRYSGFDDSELVDADLRKFIVATEFQKYKLRRLQELEEVNQ